MLLYVNYKISISSFLFTFISTLIKWTSFDFGVFLKIKRLSSISFPFNVHATDGVGAAFISASRINFCASWIILGCEAKFGAMPSGSL